MNCVGLMLGLSNLCCFKICYFCSMKNILFILVWMMLYNFAMAQDSVLWSVDVEASGLDVDNLGNLLVAHRVQKPDSQDSVNTRAAASCSFRWR